MYNNPSKSKAYFAVMTYNCLNASAQFRYLDSALLHNIERDGTLASPPFKEYKSHLAVYHGVSAFLKRYQNSALHLLKQTNAGSLLFYHKYQLVCAEPKTTYINRNKKCNTKEQEFTFGK